MFDTSSPGFGAAIDPPVYDDLADLIVAFVATEDGDEARALVEQHPELRTVEVISGLADLAGSAELEEVRCRVWTVAASVTSRTARSRRR